MPRSHDCRKTKKSEDGEIRCHYCKKLGHIQPECPLKQRHEEEVEAEREANEDDGGEEQEEEPTPEPPPQKNAHTLRNPADNSAITDAHIAEVCRRVKSGELKLAI